MKEDTYTHTLWTITPFVRNVECVHIWHHPSRKGNKIGTKFPLSQRGAEGVGVEDFLFGFTETDRKWSCSCAVSKQHFNIVLPLWTKRGKLRRYTTSFVTFCWRISLSIQVSFLLNCCRVHNDSIPWVWASKGSIWGVKLRPQWCFHNNEVLIVFWQFYEALQLYAVSGVMWA